MYLKLEMKILILSVIFILPSIVSADCYEVGDLRGYQTSKSRNYEFVATGMSGQEFKINIDGPRSFAAPQGMETRSEINKVAISCSFTEGFRGFHEVWSLDLERNVVIFSKHRSGSDYGLDGAMVLTGKILGRCK